MPDEHALVARMKPRKRRNPGSVLCNSVSRPRIPLRCIRATRLDARRMNRIADLDACQQRIERGQKSRQLALDRAAHARIEALPAYEQRQFTLRVVVERAAAFAVFVRIKFADRAGDRTDQAVDDERVGGCACARNVESGDGKQRRNWRLRRHPRPIPRRHRSLRR